MYFLALQNQYGYECVVQSTYKTIRPGDIVQDTKDIYLCLGQEVAFEPLYTNLQFHEFVEGKILGRQLFSPHTMTLIHWMVKQYFSSYKAVVQLFLQSDIESLLKKQPKKRHNTTDKETKKESSNQGQDGQICHIFPDLWSLTQSGEYQSRVKNKTENDDSIAILHGGMTTVQKSLLWRKIKNNIIKTIFTTNRGLFFDRYNLTNITVYGSNNWAFSAQSEPRFVLKEVSDKIGEIHQASTIYKSL